jgi:alpha-tubulin suppressor-like RCC1 family protein
LAVLSEELGHHLDALLNDSDTPGDEGELLALLLHGHGSSSEEQQALLLEDDRGFVRAGGQELQVEQAGRVVSTPIPLASPRRSRGEWRNSGAFAALKADGSVVTWGGSRYGGDSSAVASQLSSGVSQIFSTDNAFAALKTDGSVVTWGGNSTFGVRYGGGDSSAVASELSSGVSQIFSTVNAFAALKTDGSVVTWGGDGAYGFGGGGDSSAVASELSSGVSQIVSTENAFAALKTDGSVVFWGYYGWRSDRSAVGSKLSSGVSQIFSTDSAFAALKTDGSVVTWGYHGSGSDSSAEASQLSSGVSQIFSIKSAFAALKTDGSVVTWGYSGYGGDSSAVASQLSSGVSHIFSADSAFAALKVDGSVVTWGFPTWGGDSSDVASQLSTGVSQIVSTEGAFAALKADGSVVTWGLPGYGGDSSAVASQLSSGVSQIFSTGGAFAALKTDGSVVSWGGDGVYGQGFWSGGDSSAVASQLNNVVAFANPFTDDRLLFDLPQGPAVPPEPMDAEIPVITLDLNPVDGIQEDGPGTLVVTFTRRGSTLSPLGVNYRVAGSARPAVDYSGIPAAVGVRSITFAVGADTVSLSLDPIADALVERDETVSLALVQGVGYALGTTTAVSGTILNDDPARLSHVVSAAGVDSFSLATGAHALDRLQISISSAAVDSPQELAVFRVDDEQGRINGIEPSDPAYTQAALARAATVFSVISTSPRGFNPGAGRRLMGFAAGDKLRFLLIRNRTLDQASQSPPDQADLLFSSTAHLAVSSDGGDQYTLAWMPSTEAASDDALVVTIQATDEPLTLGAGLQGGNQGELLDLSQVDPLRMAQLSFRLNREAGYNNVVGFYKVSDWQGTIVDPLTGAAIQPEDAGYGLAALSARVSGIDLQVPNQSTISQELMVQGGTILAPFIVANGRPEQLLDAVADNDPAIYFPYLAANRDGIDHIRLLADNSFGFEDLPGGGDLDFNDMIVSVAIQVL